MLHIEVTVKRADILEKLRANKAKHQEEYREAVGGYLKAKREILFELADQYDGGWDISEDFDVKPNFGLTKPVDNSNKYEELINSFELISKDEIDISFQDATAIANDSFQWVETAKFVNAFYSSTKR